jgi:Uma2 family endonuclease
MADISQTSAPVKKMTSQEYLAWERQNETRHEYFQGEVFEMGVTTPTPTVIRTPLPIKKMTPQEYLAWERQNQTRHEYFQGEVFEMAGATETHVLITTNLVMHLGFQLKKNPCVVYASDLRLYIPGTDQYTYPDVLVACPPINLQDEVQDTLLNPVLIVEVLSESTQNYDRGEKFASYRQLPSLVDYLLISQKQVLVEYYHRGDSGWLLRDYRDLNEVVILGAVPCQLRLEDIYDKTPLAAST